MTRFPLPLRVGPPLAGCLLLLTLAGAGLAAEPEPIPLSQYDQSAGTLAERHWWRYLPHYLAGAKVYSPQEQPPRDHTHPGLLAEEDGPVTVLFTLGRAGIFNGRETRDFAQSLSDAGWQTVHFLRSVGRRRISPTVVGPGRKVRGFICTQVAREGQVLRVPTGERLEVDRLELTPQMHETLASDEVLPITDDALADLLMESFESYNRTPRSPDYVAIPPFGDGPRPKGSGVEGKLFSDFSFTYPIPEGYEDAPAIWKPWVKHLPPVVGSSRLVLYDVNLSMYYRGHRWMAVEAILRGAYEKGWRVLTIASTPRSEWRGYAGRAGLGLILWHPNPSDAALSVPPGVMLYELRYTADVQLELVKPHLSITADASRTRAFNRVRELNRIGLFDGALTREEQQAEREASGRPPVKRRP